VAALHLRRGRVLALVVLVPLLAALTGCTDDADDTAGPGTAGGDDPGGGGTLRIGLPGELNPDPAEASPASHVELMVLDLLYDGLTELDDGAMLQPGLAESWSVSDDGRTWSFVLADEAAFSDGTEIDAEAVRTSLEHVARAGAASFGATRLEPISGYEAFIEGDTDRISGLVVDPDQPQVLDIRLDRPFGTLGELLASPLYGVTQPSALEAEGGSLVTSGPLVPGEEETEPLRLVAGPRGEIVLDAIELHPHDGAQEAFDALEDGEVDWAPVPPEVATDEVVEAIVHPFHAELFLGLNIEEPPLDRRALRQAIALAIDRQAAVAAVLPEGTQPLAVLVPEGTPGHDPEACGDLCEPDRAAARWLLADAYDDDVPEVQLDFDRSPGQRTLVRTIARQLEAAGIPVELRPRPLEGYTEFVASGEQRMFSFGWIGLYPSPDAYLAPLLHSESPDNFFGYANDQVDELIEEARAADPVEEAEENLERWSEVEQRALRAAVIVPLAQYQLRVAVSPRIEGLQHRLDGSFDPSTVRLTDAD
jgi:ABC-type transport system substrate-binding protein